MVTKMNNMTGSYLLLFLTIFNFAALVCVTIYHLQYERHSKDASPSTVLGELKQEFKQWTHPKSRRSKESVPSVAELLNAEKENIFEECRRISKQEVVNILKEAVAYMRPTTSEESRKRQSGTSGNDLASIFGQIAKSEVDILTKYCGNNSQICLPGAKGDKGDPGLFGIPGAKGAHGVMGPQGLKGESGSAGQNGNKGDIGPIGPDGKAGLPGDKGDKGAKGDNGLYGVPGAKGSRGVMGPQGLKGELGALGMKGEKGDLGSDGSQGLQGPKGDKGNAADNVAPCCTSLGIPKFTEQVQEIKVTEGSNVTLTCDPAGYPPPQLVWNPNPNALDQTRTAISPKSITMVDVHTTDSKIFTCVAKNALGDSEKNFMLKVYQHLKFDKVPQNYTVMTGNPVTLECQVEGPLNPQITWYKIMPDGSRFPLTNGITQTTNGSQIHFDRMDSSKVGQYVCEGNNGLEKMQMSAFLNTYGPPHITSPSTVTVIKGQTVRLRCDADARPPAKISWSYPPGVTNAYMDTDGTMVIINAQVTDARYFICKATNQYGTDQAQISVDVKVPAEVSVIPQNVEVVPGKTNIAIECVTKGDQPLTVDWYKDGTKLTGNGHVFILPGNVLLVNQATAADLGEYTCRATNSLGSASATSIAYVSAGDVRCFDAFTVCTSEICGSKCPANCASSPAPVSGGPILYSKVSSVCKSGISSGVITDAGGTVVWRNSNMAAMLGVNQTATILPPSP